MALRLRRKNVAAHHSNLYNSLLTVSLDNFCHYHFEELFTVLVTDVPKVGDYIIEPCNNAQETGYACFCLLKGTANTE